MSGSPEWSPDLLGPGQQRLAVGRSQSIARWCSGSTSAFGAVSPGSNPGRAATVNTPLSVNKRSATLLSTFQKSRARPIQPASIQRQRPTNQKGRSKMLLRPFGEPTSLGRESREAGGRCSFRLKFLLLKSHALPESQRPEGGRGITPVVQFAAPERKLFLAGDSQPGYPLDKLL